MSKHVLATKLSRMLALSGIVLVSMFWTGQTFAQQGGTDPRVALVDSRAFTDGITEFRAQAETLEREFKPVMDQLKALNDQVQLNEEVLKRTAGDLQPDARQRKIEELEKQKKDYNRKLEDTKEAMSKRSDVVLMPLRDKITKALTAYAQEHGVSIVIDIAPAVQAGSLAYFHPGVDITEDFVKTYNQANPGKK